MGEEEDFAADRLKASREQRADRGRVAGGRLAEEQLTWSDDPACLGECLSGDALVSALRVDVDRNFGAVRQSAAENDRRGSSRVCEHPHLVAVAVGLRHARVAFAGRLAKCCSALEAAGREQKIDSLILAVELGAERGEKARTHRGEEIIRRQLGADPVLGYGARDHVVRGERHDRHRAAGWRG